MSFGSRVDMHMRLSFPHNALLAGQSVTVTSLPFSTQVVGILKPEPNLCQFYLTNTRPVIFPVFGRLSRNVFADISLLFDLSFPRASTHSSLKNLLLSPAKQVSNLFFQTQFNRSWKLENHRQTGTVVSKPFASQLAIFNKVLT